LKTPAREALGRAGYPPARKFTGRRLQTKPGEGSVRRDSQRECSAGTKFAKGSIVNGKIPLAVWTNVARVNRWPIGEATPSARSGVAMLQ
jgi:hypothetical protein